MKSYEYCICSYFKINKYKTNLSSTNYFNQSVVGRWGNFFNSEVYGRAVSLDYFRWFPSWLVGQIYISATDTGIMTMPIKI